MRARVVVADGAAARECARVRMRSTRPSRAPAPARARAASVAARVQNASRRVSMNSVSTKSDDAGIDARAPVEPSLTLINDDLAPVLASARTFTTGDMANLWVGLVVQIPSWTLCATILAQGFSAFEALACVLVANVLVLVPLVLNGVPGTKFGVGFPVLCRAAFGIRGANVAALSRAIVACGWFGIQTNMGGHALKSIGVSVFGDAFARGFGVVHSLGLSTTDLACYVAFLSMQLCVIWNGIESIRKLEEYAAPVLVALSLALFVWALNAAGGLGPMLAAPSAFAVGGARQGEFWRAFFPIVTATVGFWSTLSLNISDFTRYAKSQRAQVLGQLIGLPFFMAAFCFASIAVTSCTIVIFGAAINDPIALMSRMQNGPVATTLAMIGLILATMSTNIAANVVAPANALANAFPRSVSFRRAGLITAAIGTSLMPWKLMSGDGYVFVWLIGYAAFLGPIAGIMLADYFILRRQRLDIDDLFTDNAKSQYWYHRGFNPSAFISWLVGVAMCLPGFLHVVGAFPNAPMLFRAIYDAAFFVGFFVGGGLHIALTRALQRE